ncbi:MAG: Cu(I)-responsive transcriptional regulator [Rhodospirillaceae bacterium]|jgi:MerR family transcriptional regulator, copper efflux regulator|nr:Cu(I)-responsive transcriptional regulator [Rhodospirillaceae bacterium]
MKISEASRQSGLPAKTIRYYEETGLIAPAARAENGYRDYSDIDVHKMRFVRHARGLGFSVEVCSQLLSLYEDQGRKSADVKAIAQEHLIEVDAKIKELQELRSTLSHLVDHCHGDNKPDCPILEGIATPVGAGGA